MYWSSESKITKSLTEEGVIEITDRVGHYIKLRVEPIIAELYNEKEQIGYFLYARIEEVRSIDKTLVKFNPFIGNQTQNTWELNKFIGLRVYYIINRYLLNITRTVELLR